MENPIPNRAKVPAKKWNKWGFRARSAFNHLYFTMLDSPDLFNHPKAIKQNPLHWKTVCWNSAWLAADEVQRATNDILFFVKR